MFKVYRYIVRTNVLDIFTLSVKSMFKFDGNTINSSQVVDVFILRPFIEAKMFFMADNNLFLSYIEDNPSYKPKKRKTNISNHLSIST